MAFARQIDSGGRDFSTNPGTAKLTVAQQALLDQEAAFVPPHRQAHLDDQFFSGGTEPAVPPYDFTRAQAETYYQYLPPLTRGQVVPNLYPQGETGFFLASLDGAAVFFPRIVIAAYQLPDSQAISWTYPQVQGTAWAEALAAAFPALKTGWAAPVRTTVAAFLADKDTIVVQSDSQGAACGWWNNRWGVYLSFAPHILFDRKLRAGQLFADPTAGYWQRTYNAWLEPSWHESLRNFAEAVAVAVGAAYVAGAAVGGSAAGGSAATGGTGVTLTESAAPEALPVITEAAPLANTLATIPAVGGAAATVASSLAAGAARVGAGVAAAAVKGAVVGTVIKATKPSPSLPMRAVPAPVVPKPASLPAKNTGAIALALLAIVAVLVF